MSGCLVGLIFSVVVAIVGMIRLTFLLMATSVGSLFIGPDEATNRIATSWIEQSAGRGVNIGYSPVARGGMKVAAWILLIIGWLVTIGFVHVIVSAFGNG